MRQMGPVRRDVASDRRGHRKSDQRHEAKRKRRQLRLVRQAGKHETDRPAIATGTATPDDVATALWIGLLYTVRTMVDKAPPLTPISDPNKPMLKP